MLDSVGERIKALRETKDLSQKEIGKLTNKSQTAIYKYENNLSEADYSTLLWYADYFNVSTDWILGRVPAPGIKLVDAKAKDGRDIEIGINKGANLSADQLQLILERLDALENKVGH